MAPPHTAQNASAGRSRSVISKASSKRGQTSHKPAQRPTRLNKVQLSGTSAATSRALSLQSKDIRVSKKRSRPQPKVGRTLSKLGDLADALPVASDKPTKETKHRKDKRGPTVKSLKPRPGMQKKRAALEKNERERFSLNLAILSSVKDSQDNTGLAASNGAHVDVQNATKWAALRKHIIENTLES